MNQHISLAIWIVQFPELLLWYCIDSGLAIFGRCFDLHDASGKICGAARSMDAREPKLGIKCNDPGLICPSSKAKRCNR